MRNERLGMRETEIEKGATVAPFFLTGEVSLPFLAGLLLPALGFLCHCLISPPSSGLLARTLAASFSGCRLARSPDTGTLRVWHLPGSRRSRPRKGEVPFTSLGVASVDHPHTRCRLRSRTGDCQAQCEEKVKKSSCRLEKDQDAPSRSSAARASLRVRASIPATCIAC